MSKKVQGLFLLTLFIGFVFLPKPASAFILSEIFSLSNHILGSIEEVVGPMLGFQVVVIIAYILGISLLALSSWVLQLFIIRQGEWLKNIMTMIEAGHGFVLGIANMVLVLIFVFIAIGYILKIETFQSKKSLTRFLIIAFLINFSLLFVKMLIDVSQFLYNSIISGNENIILSTLKIFIDAPYKAILNTLVPFAALITSMAIPISNAFAQTAFAIGFQLFFLPNNIILVVQTVFMFLLSLTLFVFAFLFAARVFVIAFLAILSPLAFICSVLPQTQKWWSEWLKHLIEWLLLGVLFSFFLILGLKALGFLAPAIGTMPLPVMAWLNYRQIPTLVVYYFALFIFLVIIMFVGKSQLPSLAGFMIDQAKTVGGMFVARAKPFASETVSRIDSAVANRRAKEAELREKGEKYRANVFAGTYAGLRRFTTGITPEEAEKRRMAKAKAATEKLEDPNLVMARVSDALRLRDAPTAASYVTTAITKGGPFKRAVEKNISDNVAVALGKELILKGDRKGAEKIGRTYLPVAGQMGFSLSDSDLQKYGTIQRKLIAEAKGDEIKEFKKEFWKNPEIMEAIQDFWGGPQIGKAAEEFGKEFIDDYTNTIKSDMEKIRTLRTEEEQKKEFINYIHRNPRKALYLETSAAQALGLESTYEMAPKVIKDNYKNIKAVLVDGSFSKDFFLAEVN